MNTYPPDFVCRGRRGHVGVLPFGQDDRVPATPFHVRDSFHLTCQYRSGYFEAGLGLVGNFLGKNPSV